MVQDSKGEPAQESPYGDALVLFVKKHVRLFPPGRESSRRRRALSGVAASYLSAGVTMVVGLLLTPVILRHLGRDAYGVWAIIGQIVGYVALTDFGMRSTLQAHVSHYSHTNDRRLMGEMVSTGLAIQFALAIACAALGFAVLPFLGSLIRDAAVSMTTVRWTFIGAVLVRAISFPMEVFDQYLVGHQLVATSNLLGILSYVIRALVILLLLTRGVGLLSLPLSAFVAQGVTFVTTLVRVRRLSPWLTIGRAWVTSEWMKKLLGFSSWSFVGTMAAMVIYNTDNIVIGRMLGASYVTTYVLSRRLVEILRENINRVNNVLRPGIGDVLGKGEMELARSLFLRGMRVSVGVAVVGGILVGFIAPRFIPLWVGSGNWGGSLLVWVSVAATVVLSAFHFASVFLMGALKVRVVALSRIAEAILNLGLTIVFIKAGLGIVGAALGTLVACCVLSGWLLPHRAIRHLGIPPAAFGRSVVAPLARVGAALAAGCYLLGRVPLLSQQTWPSLLVFIACAGMIAGVSVLRWGLTPEDKKAVRAKLRWVQRVI